MEYIAHYMSPLGLLTMASDGESLTGLWFEGQKYNALTLDPEHEEKMIPVFEECREWLDQYFSGQMPEKMPTLAPKGSAFRQEVWEILLKIPCGETMTYGQIAKILAERRGIARMSAQAVGGAVGHNPIGIIIPCHRVVGSDGSMTGYAGGIDKKIELLRREERMKR